MSYDLPTRAAGYTVKAADDWNPLVNAVNDEDSRLTVVESRTTDASTGNTALGSRVTAVETTVNATGATAAGNAALSSRLGTGVTTANTATAQLAAKADKATTVTAGTGLTGGGDLSANRTLAVTYGTTAGTAAQGNDSRFTTLDNRATSLEGYATGASYIGGTAYNSATQTFSTTTDQLVFNTTTGTGYPAHTPSGITWSNNGWTVTTAGVYTVSTCLVAAPTSGSGGISATFYFASASPTSSNTWWIGAIGQVNAASVSFTRFFPAGAVVKVYANITPPATTAVGYSFFSMYHN